MFIRGWRTVGSSALHQVENFAHHQGGPILGIAVGPDDKIYFADANAGLFTVSKNGTESLLSDEADGSAIRFANGVAVARDGSIYFTDASSNGLVGSNLDLLDGQPNGRLLKYDPSTGNTSVLVKEMRVPNGVALSENEDFILVAETARARVLRYWLKGEKEGTLETFVENLPGLPDNIHFSISEKIFYIGLIIGRDQELNWATRFASKLLRCLMANPLVASLNPLRSMLITVSPEGKLVSKFEDPTKKVIPVITGGNKIGDFLYITGNVRDFLGRIRL